LTEFSKREIVYHLGVPPDRISVIYPGVVSQPFQVASQSSQGVAQPFRAAVGESNVLYVGSIFNRRHVPETIRGFERLTRVRSDIRLTIVGDNRTFPRVDLAGVVRDHRRVEIKPFVSDEVLGDLYRRARAFVFLSEYEGFGLTPLEALAAGIPVVVLDTPVAREVYGAAALYVRAPDPGQIEHALELALFDDALRSTLLAAAPAIVARYSWAECARRVLAALVRAAR